MKNKVKSLSFWLEFSGVLVLLVDAISSIFDVQLYSGIVDSIITTVCIVLISLGVITKKNEKDTQNISKNELLNEINNKKQ